MTSPPSVLMNAVVLPVVTIQPSVGEVIEDVKEGLVPLDSFWLSCYKTAEPSIHTKISVELDEKDRDLVRLKSEDRGVSIELIGSGKKPEGYRVSASALGITDVRVLCASQEYVDLEGYNAQKPKRIEAFDISPDGSRFATGFQDGSVMIYPTAALQKTTSFLPKRVPATGSKVQARPHLSGLTSVRFFPSSRVLLTSGLDFSLSIIPADLPDSPESSTAKTVEAVRTLRGHKRAITSTGIIAAGRNILSSSLDSTVKLWDVPSGTEIASLSASSAVLSTSVGHRGSFLSNSEPSTDPREIPEVQDHVVFAGLQDGSFEVFDLASKKAAHRTTPSSHQIASIVYSDQEHLVATGSNKGLVSIYDVRVLDRPLTSFVRQDGEILDLALLSPRGLAVATSDGLPFIATLDVDGAIRTEELIGVDCDPVRHIRVREGADRCREVWMASDDSIVRRYEYSNV